MVNRLIQYYQQHHHYNLDNMDLDNQLDSDFGDLDLSAEGKSYLLETAKWAKIIARVGFVGVGIFTLLFGYQIYTFTTSNVGISFLAWNALISLFFIFAYLIPLQYLWKFATNTESSFNGVNTSNLAIGLKNLKSALKFIAVTTLLFIGFCILFFGWNFIFI